MATLNKTWKFLPSVYNCTTVKTSVYYSEPTYTTDKTSDKPYKCNMCQNSFKRRTAVLRHQLIHSGEKLFECPHCLKSFNRKDTLDRHFESRKCKRVKSRNDSNHGVEIDYNVETSDFAYDLPQMPQYNRNGIYEHSKYIYGDLYSEDVPDHPLLANYKRNDSKRVA